MQHQMHKRYNRIAQNVAGQYDHLWLKKGEIIILSLSNLYTIILNENTDILGNVRYQYDCFFIQQSYPT